MAHLFRPGDPAFLSRLNGAWASYAVTWASTGTAPAIGNGTLTGAWQRLGDIFFYSVSLTFGSTTSSGTGAWSFSLPLTAMTPFGLTVNGAGQACGQDTGVALYRGRATLFGTSAIAIYSNASTAPWGQTAPFTWGNTDALVFSGWQGAATP